VNEDVQIQTSTASGIFVTQNTGDTDNDIKMVISDDVKITTSGNTHHGIYVDGAATVDIESGADIQTSGSTARGIYINDALGSVTIVSNGDITTTQTATNAYASGIFVNDSVGAVYVKSTGDITTSGGRSRGIFVLDADSSVEIKSYGAITTKSGSGGGNSSGILSFTAGDVDIEAHGDITTYGTSSGIYTYDTGGNVNITVSGNITTGTNYASSPSTTSNAWGVGCRGYEWRCGCLSRLRWEHHDVWRIGTWHFCGHGGQYSSHRRRDHRVGRRYFHERQCRPWYLRE